MPRKRSLLEQLIEVSPETTSDERRDVLRQLANTLLAAPDRYSCREMEHFDLLLTKAGKLIEHKISRVLAMALTKSGAPKNLVRKLLVTPRSSLDPILNKSVSLSALEVMTLVQTQCTEQFNAKPITNIDASTLVPENRYNVPKPFLDALFRYSYLAKRHDLAKTVNPKLLPVLDRTVNRFKEQILTDSATVACDELIVARKEIMQRLKLGDITDDHLLESLKVQQYTEFYFSLSSRLETDIATTQCILSDPTFEALAIACRSAEISRVTFANFVNHLQSNNDDQSYGLKVIGLYNKLEKDASDRVMRFWGLLVKSLKVGEQSTLSAAEPPPFVNSTQQTEKKGFGRA